MMMMMVSDEGDCDAGEDEYGDGSADDVDDHGMGGDYDDYGHDDLIQSKPLAKTQNPQQCLQ